MLFVSILSYIHPLSLRNYKRHTDLAMKLVIKRSLCFKEPTPIYLTCFLQLIRLASVLYSAGPLRHIDGVLGKTPLPLRTKLESQKRLRSLPGAPWSPLRSALRSLKRVISISTPLSHKTEKFCELLIMRI